MISDKQVEAACVAYAGDDEIYAKSFEAMKRALIAAEAAAWEPAETCPNDGSMVLVYRPLAWKSHDMPLDVKRAIGGNQHCWPSTVPEGQSPMNPTDGSCHVTLWRPLPQPPKETT